METTHVEIILFFIYMYKRSDIDKYRKEILEKINKDNIFYKILNNLIDFINDDGLSLNNKHIFYNIITNINEREETNLLSQINILTNNTNIFIEGYTINNIDKVLNIYKNNNTSLYYYNTLKYKSLIEINILPDNITKNINGKTYKYVKNITNNISLLDDILKILIYKLSLSKETYIVWENTEQNNFYIELINHNNIYFIYTKDTEKIVFSNNNNNYQVLLSYKSSIGIWTYYMNNGFIILKGNSYYILLLINNAYFDTNIYTKECFFIKNQLNYGLGNNNICNIHIIKLNNTYLSLNTDNMDDIFALYISSIITKNTIVLNLIYNIINSLFINQNFNKSIYFKYINIKKNIDIPYWALFDTIQDTSSASSYIERIKYLSRHKTISDTIFDLSFITDMKEYKLT